MLLELGWVFTYLVSGSSVKLMLFTHGKPPCDSANHRHLGFLPIVEERGKGCEERLDGKQKILSKKLVDI